MSTWLVFITSLPTANATARQRVWRALRASGAAVLRDGVYLMPDRQNCRDTLETMAAEVRAGTGAAWILGIVEAEGEFQALFDRSGDYAILLADCTRLQAALATATAKTTTDLLKQVRKLRKAFVALVAIDFFPGAAQQQTASVLDKVELTITRILSPDEPHAKAGPLQQYALKSFQGRLWATRQKPWVDRLASAWLIQRFIDPSARFLWLANAKECPRKAVGFDFDGAKFSHVGNRVTFEVLLSSFGLEQQALLRMAALVHFLDVGGVPAPEAAGVESILAGLRARAGDDNQMLADSLTIFDGLYAAFSSEGDIGGTTN